MCNFLGLKRFQCDTCKKQFGFKKDLVNHLRTHSGERPFSCDICHKDFAHDSSLKLHKKTHFKVDDIENGNLENIENAEKVVETALVKVEDLDQTLIADENELGIKVKNEFKD